MPVYLLVTIYSVPAMPLCSFYSLHLCWCCPVTPLSITWCSVVAHTILVGKLLYILVLYLHFAIFCIHWWWVLIVPSVFLWVLITGYCLPVHRPDASQEVLSPYDNYDRHSPCDVEHLLALYRYPTPVMTIICQYCHCCWPYSVFTIHRYRDIRVGDSTYIQRVMPAMTLYSALRIRWNAVWPVFNIRDIRWLIRRTTTILLFSTWAPTATCSYCLVCHLFIRPAACDACCVDLHDDDTVNLYLRPPNARPSIVPSALRFWTAGLVFVPVTPCADIACSLPIASDASSRRFDACRWRNVTTAVTNARHCCPRRMPIFYMTVPANARYLAATAVPMFVYCFTYLSWKRYSACSSILVVACLDADHLQLPGSAFTVICLSYTDIVVRSLNRPTLRLNAVNTIDWAWRRCRRLPELLHSWLLILPYDRTVMCACRERLVLWFVIRGVLW